MGRGKEEKGGNGEREEEKGGRGSGGEREMEHSDQIEQHTIVFK